MYASFHLKCLLFVIKMYFFCHDHMLFFTTGVFHAESLRRVWVCVSLVWGMERFWSSWWPGSLPHRFLWVAEVDWPQIYQTGSFNIRIHVALQPAAGWSLYYSTYKEALNVCCEKTPFKCLKEVSFADGAFFPLCLLRPRVCVTLTLHHFHSLRVCPALLWRATISFQGSVWINNRSRVVQSDYITYDGVIHHVSTLLTPYSLKDKQEHQTQQVTHANKPLMINSPWLTPEWGPSPTLSSDEPNLSSCVLRLHTLLQINRGKLATGDQYSRVTVNPVSALCRTMQVLAALCICTSHSSCAVNTSQTRVADGDDYPGFSLFRRRGSSLPSPCPSTSPSQCSGPQTRRWAPCRPQGSAGCPARITEKSWLPSWKPISYAAPRCVFSVRGDPHLTDVLLRISESWHELSFMVYGTVVLLSTHISLLSGNESVLFPHSLLTWCTTSYLSWLCTIVPHQSSLIQAFKKEKPTIQSGWQLAFDTTV